MQAAGSLGGSYIRRIEVPCPPILGRALGYKGQARYIAVWWEPGVDEVWITDGRVGFDGEWHAYLTYVKHPRVHPMLNGFNLGSSEAVAEYALMIDQAENTVSIGPRKKVQLFITLQWPPAPVVELSPEELERMGKAMQEAMKESLKAGIDMETVQRMMEENNRLAKEVKEFLDNSIANN